MKDFRRHAVEWVATLITESLSPIEEDIRYLAKVNKREGFTIDYIPPGLPNGHWLQVEGVRLSAQEMKKAVSLAKEWLKA